MRLIELNNFFQLIGSFWSKLTASTALTKRVLAAVLWTHRQSEQKADELVKSVSNVEISAGQVTVLEKMTFTINQFPGLQYNTSGAVYNLNYFYGDVLDNKAIYLLPKSIISIPLLYDDPVDPTKIYTENVDYIIEDGKITFKIPFDGETTILYGRQIVKDTGFAYRQLGYVLGLNLSDRIFRKIPLKEFWRLYSYGANYYNTLNIIALCANAPITKHAIEVVEGIQVLTEGSIIITDKEIYFVPVGAQVLVKQYDVLPQATSLTSALTVLHDKLPVADSSLPEFMRVSGYLRYGNKVANPARTLIVKADISGETAVALQYFLHIMPLDAKVILLANINIPAPAIPSEFVSCTTNRTLSLRLSDTFTANTNNNLTIAAKCEFRLKYTA